MKCAYGPPEISLEMVGENRNGEKKEKEKTVVRYRDDKINITF